MTRLNRIDNGLLRNQEWRLLFRPGPNNTSSSSSEIPPLPTKFAQDTFLVKSFFSESNEKYYLILVTNLKQFWYEKLQIEDIRERSKKIKSFAYEEDSQLEALLLSLSSIFTSGSDSSSALASPAPRWIEKNKEKLALIVEFKFGLANVQWEFNLSPMLEATGISHHNHFSNSVLSKPNLLNEELSLQSIMPDWTQPTGKRARYLLEDSDDDGDIEDVDQDGIGSDNQDGSDGDDNDNDDEDNIGYRSNKKRKKVDGMSVMFDHLILPLISLTNAYHNQIRGLEAVVKSKENEVVEALEMLEQSGVGYSNRRKATERYDKARAEAKLQKDIELLTRPHLFGPKELFSDKNVPGLLSIVSKNAANRDTPLSSFERSTISSQGVSSLSQNARGISSSQSARRSGDVGTMSQPATAGLAGDSENAAASTDGSSAKAAKEAEELERRRVLQEQLDKEKAEKEKSRKKKKLF
ncbi:hypothetical protein BGX26_002227 [Mortierella sp. AD094]|nr:hypothetical protein BGX26_002227 [Mortierella sp. AD094]